MMHLIAHSHDTLLTTELILLPPQKAGSHPRESRDSGQPGGSGAGSGQDQGEQPQDSDNQPAGHGGRERE